MKKFLFTLFVLLIAASSANADNYFSLRTTYSTVENGTLRINPSLSGTYEQMFMVAHFDGYLDHWYITMNHPTNIPIYENPVDTLAIKEGTSMSVPYINSAGIDTLYYALLLNKTVNQIADNSYNSYFSSTITEFGYWDPYNNGNYMAYGTVKWGPGDHDEMFRFKFWVPFGLTDADVCLNAVLSSTNDWRGVPTVNMNPCISNIHIHVGFRKGDVNGDGFVNVGDVTQLTDWMMTHFAGANVYHLEACDVNGDGEIGVDDVSALIDLVLSQGD